MKSKIIVIFTSLVSMFALPVSATLDNDLTKRVQTVKDSLDIDNINKDENVQISQNWDNFWNNWNDWNNSW